MTETELTERYGNISNSTKWLGHNATRYQLQQITTRVTKYFLSV